MIVDILKKNSQIISITFKAKDFTCYTDLKIIIDCVANNFCFDLGSESHERIENFTKKLGSNKSYSIIIGNIDRVLISEFCDYSLLDQTISIIQKNPHRFVDD